MKDIYIGHVSHVSREFAKDGTLTDLDALTISIKNEATGEYLVTTAEGTFRNLNILANKSATGKYFTKVTPDANESEGVYLLYWTATYGTGAAAKTFDAGPDVLYLHAEAAIPALADNYLSLDGVAKEYPDLFDLATPVRILQVGYIVSRDMDARFDERFNVPIRKKPDGTYDQPLIDAAVALAVARVLDNKGYPDEAERWQKRGDGTVEDINNGRRRLQEEMTRDEIGFGVPKPASSNTGSHVELELRPGAPYSDSYRRKYVVEIDGAGSIGAATFKISIDAGRTWIVTARATSEIWYSPEGGYGLTLRFFALSSTATLALGDSWTFDAVPTSTEVTASTRAIRTAELRL
jgi:hypothetical protein